MTKREEYEQIAAECLRTAGLAADPGARAWMLDMARAWHALADQADRNNKRDLDYEVPSAPMAPAEQQQLIALPQQHGQPGEESSPTAVRLHLKVSVSGGGR